MNWNRARALFVPALLAAAGGCGESPSGYERLASHAVPPAAPGGVAEPMGVAEDAEGRLYVADAGGSRIAVLTSAGEFVESWKGAGGEPFVRPFDLARTPDGELLALDFGSGRILRLDPGTGGGDTLALAERLRSPAGFDVAEDGTLLVASFQGHRVSFPNAPGRASVGGEGSEPGRLFYPTDVTAIPGGGFWVADAYNHRLQRFDAEGRSVETVGRQGTGDGAFDIPVSAALGADGTLHVADSGNGRVVAVSPDGRWLGAWHVPGGTGTGFHAPSRIVATGDGTLLVADPAHGRVHRLQWHGPAGDATKPEASESRP